MKKLLFISNGYGEDAISAKIAITLQKKASFCSLAAFPTVGDGKIYEEKGIPLAGRGVTLPSEGFVRSFKDLALDLKSGLIQKTLRMGLLLKKVSQDIDYLLITGDPYLLLFCSIFTVQKKQRKIFIGVQQSEYYGTKKPFKQHYSFIERIWLKSFAGLVFVRDKKTEIFLKKKGLKNVLCTGNPMMDTFEVLEKNIFPEDRELIGILPGSKKEAYENLEKIFEIITYLQRERNRFIFAMALPSQLDIKKITGMFNLEGKNRLFTKKGKPLHLCQHPYSGAEIIISSHLFGEIISSSKLVIGLSGTANEQAAGLGKPVVAFWGKGPQVTKKFMKAQKKLLGEALFLYPPEPSLIATAILRIINDPQAQKKAAEDGMRRMRGRGSIQEMVEFILNYIDNKQ